MKQLHWVKNRLEYKVAVMERLGIIEAMAFDEHFNQYGDFILLG